MNTLKTTPKTMIFLLTLFAIYAISMPVSAEKQLPQGVSRALDSISTEEGITIISELASDDYGGRLTGSEGQWKAAELVREHFINSGLKPKGGKHTFYQEFTLATNQILPTPVLEVKTSEYEYEKYVFGSNFVCRGFSGSGDIRAEVVFCGYGVTTDKYDDYANVDVEGKIVLVMNGVPGRGLRHPTGPDDYAKWNTAGKKINNAIDHGAAGILFTGVLPDGEFRKLVVSTVWGDYPHQTEFPAFVVDRHIVSDILKKSGQDLPVLMGLMNKELKPLSYNTGTTAHMRCNAEFNPVTSTANVVGLLEGAHPTLKNEYIVIGAHMDHVGTQGADIICPGANDNASGVATLLEIAEAFKNANLKPKRSIIFVAFTAEEMGLKGARYFVDHLPVSKHRIKAMINLDMLGQGHDTLLTFSKDFPSITATAQRANKNLHNLAMPVIPAGSGSDHRAFVDVGIPATMFLTGGEYDYPYHHTHYHYREWMINIDLWKKATDTVFLTLWYMAN